MSGKHWSIIPGTVSYVQRYCGLEKRQVTLALSVGGLDGSLPQIFSYLKIWVFRLHSLTSHLSFSPFSPQSRMHIKRFIPAMKLNELYQREKNWNFKIQVLCEQEEWVSNNLLIFY